MIARDAPIFSLLLFRTTDNGAARNERAGGVWGPDFFDDFLGEGTGGPWQLAKNYTHITPKGMGR
jgi:hypothetical protein